MAKGPIVTERVQFLIASVYQKHPKWKAPEVRNEVSFLMRKSNPKLPSSWPSLSSVQKILATVRRNMKELSLNPKEKPWSMASMLDYPIPAEALPSILELWVWMRENLNAHLTIRQAQWAARFYTVIRDMPYLAAHATGYAVLETASELTGTPFVVSRTLDLAIFRQMTGQDMDPEREKKILALSDEEWLALKETRELLAKEDFPQLGIPQELTDIINYVKNMEKQRVKEVQQNEGAHQAKG